MYRATARRSLRQAQYLEEVMNMPEKEELGKDNSVDDGSC